MHWSIPLISAIAGGVLGWFTRWTFDRRSERTSLVREIYNTYMSITDDEPIREREYYRLHALQRAGALRLPITDFDNLIHDIARAGRPAPVNDDLVQILGLRQTLEAATAANVDLCNPESIFRWMIASLDRFSEIAKKRNIQPWLNLLQHIEKQ